MSIATSAKRLLFPALLLFALPLLVLGTPACGDSGGGGSACDDSRDCVFGEEFCSAQGRCEADRCRDKECPLGQTCDSLTGNCLDPNANNGGNNGNGNNNNGNNNNGNNAGNNNNGNNAGNNNNNGNGNNAGNNNGNGGVEPMGECSLLQQDCEAGMACGLDMMNMTVCAMAGMEAEGAPCGAGAGNCQAGFICGGAQGAQTTCLKFCDINMAASCGAGAACSGLQTAAGTVGGVGVCIATQGCDIVAQNCEPGEGCYLFANADGPTCAAAGDVNIGQACGQDLGNCVPGGLCVGVNEGGPSCFRVCSTADGAGCQAGENCNALQDVDGIGICIGM